MSRPIHRKLILPGDVERSGGALTIHVPSGYANEDERMEAGGYLVCRVIVDHDRRLMCGKLFEPGQDAAFERHVGKCAQAHLDEIRKASPRARMPILDEESWDPEVAAHMREVGARMLKEGRLTVKPSERAGF